MRVPKRLSWVVMVAVLLAGPLAPLTTSAQVGTSQVSPPLQPGPLPAAPPVQSVPSPISPPVAPVTQFSAVEPTPSYRAQELEPTQGDAIGAGFLNVVYVPGKVITCVAGATAATVLMLLSFGSGYSAATGIFKEGCAGTWVLTPEHVSGKVPPDYVRTDGYRDYYSRYESYYP
jgi:hypothetical protein